jgi:hypothetical protein
MSKRKLEDDIICNYTEEDRSFKPKTEILSVDADSSLMAPKANIPARMLPRHLQKRKANPNKKLTDEKKDNKKLPDLSQIVRPESSLLGVPSYPPPGFYGAVNPMVQPNMMANQAYYPSFPGAYGQPAMPYYGEVPLQPPQARQDKKSLPKVQVKKILRTAGGEVWEDPTLAEWSKDDYRIFVGNLGHEVTDDGLKRSFMQYKSLNKARVVHDKRNDKSRGFGFVSFLDPQDFIRALKEMNGKYVGNRPCKLTKSRWDDRSFETYNEKHKKDEK